MRWICVILQGQSCGLIVPYNGPAFNEGQQIYLGKLAIINLINLMRQPRK